MQAARHKTEKCALVYTRDCRALLEIAIANGDLLVKPVWKNPYIFDRQSAVSLNTCNGMDSLTDAAIIFIMEVLGVEDYVIYIYICLIFLFFF